jgi:flagellar protein FliO/FliZ
MEVHEGMQVMQVRQCVERARRCVVGKSQRVLAFSSYIIAITFIAASAAIAAEADKPFAAPQAAERVATPSAGSLAQVTLSLLLVLGAVFAAAWLMRRLKGIGRFASGPIEIVADVSLGAKERAVLVQVGGKQLLLGVAPGRVNVLHALDEPIARDGLRPTGGGHTSPANIAAGAAQRPDFKSILKRSLGL